jgi:hypothetical protein
MNERDSLLTPSGVAACTLNRQPFGYSPFENPMPINIWNASSDRAQIGGVFPVLMGSRVFGWRRR